MRQEFQESWCLAFLHIVTIQSKNSYVSLLIVAGKTKLKSHEVIPHCKTVEEHGGAPQPPVSRLILQWSLYSSSVCDIIENYIKTCKQEVQNQIRLLQIVEMKDTSEESQTWRDSNP